ncbi:MAG: ribosome maturation factor RimP [Bryobacteraceae bacterium]|nr:ribosome maturation factor RimP [Bryobacteraceae bacterium]
MSALEKESVLQKVNEIARQVAGSEGIELFDLELLGGGSKRVLRITIDRPQGVTHDDCELVSRRVGEILDQQDVMPGDSYTLEVTSPGVERRLSRPEHFERFLGQKAKVVLREPVENRRHWEGTLTGFAGGVVTLEPAPGQPVRFSLNQIQRANLKFEW